MTGVLKFSPLVRAIAVIGAVAALAGGATFAALQSQATLTNTTINSATASLKLWNGSSFESTAPGFTVTNVVPGQGSAPQAFYFKNDGGVPLAVTATVPVAPTYAGVAEASDVEVDITCYNNATVNTNLEALLAGPVSLNLVLPAGAQGDSGNPNTVGNCTAVFDFDPAGVSGSSASVGPFDVVFTGTQPVSVLPE